MGLLHAAARSRLALIAAREWPEIRTPVQLPVMGLIVDEDEHAGRCYCTSTDVVEYAVR